MAEAQDTARLVVTVRPAAGPDTFPEVELAGTREGLVWLAEAILRVARAEPEQHTHLDAEACAPVYVSGAVVQGGHHLLTPPATISAAIEAAGGLAQQPQMWPAGPLTVRRPLGERKVDVWRFHLDEPRAWESFTLQTGDSVVVQCYVADAGHGATPDGEGM